MHRHFAIWMLFSSLALGFAGCGGSWTYNVVGTRRDPGAEGTVQVTVPLDDHVTSPRHYDPMTAYLLAEAGLAQ